MDVNSGGVTVQLLNDRTTKCAMFLPWRLPDRNPSTQSSMAGHRKEQNLSAFFVKFRANKHDLELEKRDAFGPADLFSLLQQQ